MRATEILVREHDIILKVLDGLEQLAGQAELDRADAGVALTFLTEYADRRHHKKEEDRLFPALVAKGLPGEAGPIAVMLAEHDEGRGIVAGMRAALAELEAGEAAGQERFQTLARQFVALLRDHIAKENQVLFPMANQLLPDGEQAELAAAFDSDEEALGQPTPAGLVAEARALCERLGLDWDAAPTQAVHSCGMRQT